MLPLIQDARLAPETRAPLHTLRVAAIALVVSLVTFATPLVHAATAWTDWTAALTTGASPVNVVTGQLNLGGAPVDVTFRGATDAVELSGADWWNVSSSPDTYSSTGAPDRNDIIRLVGGDASRYEITFSTAVTDPVVAFFSLGTAAIRVDYQFDQSPVLLSSGSGLFGGCATCLLVEGNSVSGTEGYGAVQFKGSHTELTWTIPRFEYWHGFTVGAGPVASVPEPSVYVLLASGLLVGVFVARRRIRRR